MYMLNALSLAFQACTAKNVSRTELGEKSFLETLFKFFFD